MARHCRNCQQLLENHVAGKCLFEATQFEEMTLTEHLDFGCECEIVSVQGDTILAKKTMKMVAPPTMLTLLV